MTPLESRTHMGMWVVTSAPLILGFDLSDDKAVEQNWDIIANPEVLRVSQSWEGHPGRLVKNWKHQGPVVQSWKHLGKWVVSW